MAETKKQGPRSKRKFTSKRKFEKEDIREKSKYGKDNDASWYLVNGQLAKDVASFSFNNATGDRMVFSSQDLFSSGTNAYYRMPGIASVLTGPSIGVAIDATSPINVASRNIYSFVRHANSGHSNYDPNDLMTYLLAMDSIQTFWSYLVRMYGVTQTFQQRNRYIGDALISAMGGVPSDIRANIAQLRAYINQYAIQASVLAVPNTMSYYLRHAWMYQNVYCDEDNAKAQLFMYVPAYLYKYDIMSNGAGGLKAAWLCGEVNSNTGSLKDGVMGRTLSQLITYGDVLLNAVLSQEDVGIMSGDILKAYGSEKLYRFNQIDENYAIAPVFSEEVLAQFHNSTFSGRRLAFLDTSEGSGVYRIDANRALDVLQNNEVGKGWLEFAPAFCNATELDYTQILDLWTQDVSPELALVASRNKMVCNISGIGVVDAKGQVTSTYKACPLQTCGSEVLIDITIFVYDDNSNALVSYDVIPRYNMGYNPNIPVYTTKFNQFPLLRGTAIDGTGVTFPLGEISNYALLNYQDIAPMHQAALLSMFGVPYQW